MRWLRASCLVLVVSVPIAVWSCGSGSSNSGFPGGGHDASSGSSSGGGDDGGSNGDDGPSYQGFGDSGPEPPQGDGGCTNLQCDVHSCGSSDAADAGSTTLSGQVFDPAGRNPLYNVVVYVPNSKNGALDPIPIGVNSTSCSCGALFSGEPIVYALTDADGKFTLTNVPDGTDIPLVVQIGKWRKEITVPKVTACTSNDSGPIDLPKNLTDGAYASIPNIAVSTGGADTLECLLTRVGVDTAFFTGDANGPGVHIFQGAGGNAAAGGSPSSPSSLWDSQNDLMRYDIVMLSCEGSPTTGVDGTTAGYLAPYVNSGGRVFAEHYHYAFFTSYATLNGTAYPQFQNVADWTNLGTNGNDEPYSANISGVIETTLPSGAAFPEGVALKAWLGNVGALVNGEIVVPEANARDTATVTAQNVSTPWVQTDPSVTPASAQYFSWDMPFNPPVSDAGVPEYCGRVVYSDMHVTGSPGAEDYSPVGIGVVPDGCDTTKALSPDEDAIEFILFDLSSCITPVGYTPQPPQPEGGMAQ
jgi:hypothetical protein